MAQITDQTAETDANDDNDADIKSQESEEVTVLNSDEQAILKTSRVSLNNDEYDYQVGAQNSHIMFKKERVGFMKDFMRTNSHDISKDSK